MTGEWEDSLEAESMRYEQFLSEQDGIAIEEAGRRMLLANETGLSLDKIRALLFSEDYDMQMVDDIILLASAKANEYRR